MEFVLLSFGVFFLLGCAATLTLINEKPSVWWFIRAISYRRFCQAGSRLLAVMWSGVHLTQPQTRPGTNIWSIQFIPLNCDNQD